MQVLLRMLCAIPAHILVVSLFRRGDIAMTNGIARLVLVAGANLETGCQRLGNEI